MLAYSINEEEALTASSSQYKDKIINKLSIIRQPHFLFITE